MRRTRQLVARASIFGISGLVGLAGLAPACGSDGAPAVAPIASDASVDHVAAVPTVEAPKDGAVPIVDATMEAQAIDAGACNVRLESPVILDSPHLTEGTPITTYDSNPPSSGPHYPVWANFEVFTHPVADPYLVHAMEHGAVVLLYKCDADAGPDAGADCAATVAALRAIRDALPDDPICDPAIRVRIIIAPRPANDVPIAAAAWGQVYRADCLDVPSLSQFVSAHYGMGTEQLCVAGSIF